MRIVTGNVVLPANAPSVTAKLVLIEARDVSFADAPSVVVAEQLLTDVPLRPNEQIGFKLLVPEVESNRTLSLRVHVSPDGSGRAKSGDLLTTANYPISSTGTPEPQRVEVVVI